MKYIEELKAAVAANAANQARIERNHKIRMAILAIVVLFFLLGPLFMAFGQVVEPPKDLPTIKDAKPGRGYVALSPAKRDFYHKQSHEQHGGRITMMAKNLSLPATFDCRDKGWLLATGNQGSCGSCYLYSTVYGTASSAFIIGGYAKPDGSFRLAVQWGMDCHNFGGCNGGNGTEVIDYMVKNGWPAEKYIDSAGVAHNDYPAYSARSQSCRTVSGAKMWKPSAWGFVKATGTPSVEEIKAAMYQYGPINIALDAGGQFGNGTGMITSLGNSIDHEINCVGWDDSKQAFLLWNQWDTSWGVGGFRWCSYAASKHIVDWFWVSVNPLPPPPPPPPSAVPVITSSLGLEVGLNTNFTYQITATNSPTAFSANMPAGWTVSATGLVSGFMANPGTAVMLVSATNAAGTGTASVLVTSSVNPPPPPTPIGQVKMTLSADLKAGDYEIHKLGTRAAIMELLGGADVQAMKVKSNEPLLAAPPIVVPMGKVETADRDEKIRQLERERDELRKELNDVMSEVRKMKADIVKKK